MFALGVGGGPFVFILLCLAFGFFRAGLFLIYFVAAALVCV